MLTTRLVSEWTMFYKDDLLHFMSSEVVPSPDQEPVMVLHLIRKDIKFSHSKIDRPTNLFVNSKEWDGQWNIPDAVIHLIKEMYGIRRTEFL